MGWLSPLFHPLLTPLLDSCPGLDWDWVGQGPLLYYLFFWHVRCVAFPSSMPYLEWQYVWCYSHRNSRLHPLLFLLLAALNFAWIELPLAIQWNPSANQSPTFFDKPIDLRALAGILSCGMPWGIKRCYLVLRSYSTWSLAEPLLHEFELSHRKCLSFGTGLCF